MVVNSSTNLTLCAKGFVELTDFILLKIILTQPVTQNIVLMMVMTLKTKEITIPLKEHVAFTSVFRNKIIKIRRYSGRMQNSFRITLKDF